MIMATYPIYFSSASEKQYEELCREIESFEEIWESVIFWIKKDPSHCGAVQLKNGLQVKNMLLRSPQGELWIAFTHSDACVVIQGINFKEGTS